MTSTFCWDLETFLIQPGVQAPPIVCLSFCVDDGAPQLIHVSDPAFRTTIEWALANTTLTAHNARFDLTCLLSHNPEWVGPVFSAMRADRVTCTLIREQLIRIARADQNDRVDLATCFKQYTGTELAKEGTFRLSYGTLYGTPVEAWPEEAKSYSLLDAEVERTVFQAQEKHSHYLVDQWRQTRASMFLYLMQCWGMTTDPVQVEQLHKDVLEALERDRKLCVEAGLVRPDGTRNMKAAASRLEAAYEAQGREPPRGEITEKMAAKGADTGNLKLDEEACENSGDPLLAAYSRVSQATTLIRKVERLRHPIINAGYNTLVATGRTSCRQGSDPKKGQAPSAFGSNIQNPPREVLGADGKPRPGVRECFVARPGHAIVSCDFDSFELRTFAQCCRWIVGYSKLGEILNDPKRCPHVELGARIHEISAEEAYALKKIDPKRFKALRQIAKGPGFGLPGGMGPARLIDYCRQGYGVELTLERSKEICALWRRVFPEAQPYLDHINKLLPRRPGVEKVRTTITQFKSGRVRGGVGYCDTANGFFQGLASDAAKASAWALTEEMYEKKSSPLYGCRPLAFIHDEFLISVPLEGLHERAHHMAKVQAEAAQEWVPDIAITCSPAASLRWSKSAGDGVYRDGKLVPFEWRETA